MTAASGFRESATPNTAQRVKLLEKQLAEVRKVGPAILQTVNNEYKNLSHGIAQRLSRIDEVLTVLVEEIGVEEVNARIEARRLKAQMEEAERSKQAIAEGLQKGLLEVAFQVAEDSLIVGFETNADGTQASPAFSSLPFAQLQPHLKASFLNTKAGDVVGLPDGGTFTIDDIYKIQREKIEAAAAAEREQTLKAMSEPPPEVLEPAAEAAAAV
jgi:hypothetical protein